MIKKNRLALVSCLLLLGATLGLVGYAKIAAIEPPKTNTNIAPALITEETQLVSLLAKILPAVVNIVGVNERAPGQVDIVSRGTGFIVDSNGLILTNKHVVSGEKIKYRVYFSDGRRYDAIVASKDPLKDVAIVKIEGENLPTLKLGNSDDIKVGQTAIAIGNSVGRYANSVTRGIISGLGRTIAASDDVGQVENLDDVIQTDANINPGNSGGPLLNARGEVIGINTAIDTTGQGLGFAVPSNEAAKSLALYRKHKRIVRPFLGLHYLMITPDVQDEFKISYDYGALVYGSPALLSPVIIPNSPAEKAGIKAGDIILALNGRLLRGQVSLQKLLQSYEVGNTITLKISRQGQLLELPVTLVEVPSGGIN